MVSFWGRREKDRYVKVDVVLLFPRGVRVIPKYVCAVRGRGVTRRGWVKVESEVDVFWAICLQQDWKIDRFGQDIENKI